MSKTASILAIDQGTTGSTCLVIAQDGRVLGRAYSEFTQHFPRPGWVEHDAGEIWDVTRAVAREALESATEADVRGIRNHESAGDSRPVGPEDPGAGLPGYCVAGSANRGLVRPSSRKGATRRR